MSQLLWLVKWHREAIEERRAIDDTAERVAIIRVIDKLEVEGPSLPFPHQSAVKGQVGLRELRPRRGRSRWRPIYRRLGREVFIVLSVGPEAGVDRLGYLRSIRFAKRRLNSLSD